MEGGLKGGSCVNHGWTGTGSIQGRILLCNGYRAHGNGTVGVSDSETLKGAEDLLQTDYTGYIKSV